MKLPEILTSISGEKITTAQDWEKYRRNEIYYLFENFVYGKAPQKPKDMTFSVETKTRDGGILQKDILISFDGFSIRANLFLPAGHVGKLPAFLVNMHEFEEKKCDFNVSLDYDEVPVLDILQRGYALATMPTHQICPDKFTGEPYGDGIFQAIDYEKGDNSWSIIASWAWGLSRVLDYLETDPDVDASRVAVIGHSRSGKTALWAGASDPRFAMACSNDSGCTGAAVTRGKKGEHVKDINDHFHWFCENYIKFNENEDWLPVDQHMLLALIAPRPLCVASASEDEWADPDSELLSCRLASAVYQLYGKDGLVAPETIENDKQYGDGMISYHRRFGEHRLTKFDWNFYLNFADKHLK